jgi:hypothetical protein
MLHAKLSLARRGPSTHEKTRLHHAPRRRGGCVAARRKRAAGGDAGDWVPRLRLVGERRGYKSAVLEGLSEAGYIENQNVTIEYRYAEGQFERLPRLAANLVKRGVSVIIASPRTEVAAKSATATIPIIFMSGSDPVRAGLVTSLSRPTENLTGVTILAHDLETKRIGLLRELVPGHPDHGDTRGGKSS